MEQRLIKLEVRSENQQLTEKSMQELISGNMTKVSEALQKMESKLNFETDEKFNHTHKKLEQATMSLDEVYDKVEEMSAMVNEHAKKLKKPASLLDAPPTLQGAGTPHNASLEGAAENTFAEATAQIEGTEDISPIAAAKEDKGFDKPKRRKLNARQQLIQDMIEENLVELREEFNQKIFGRGGQPPAFGQEQTFVGIGEF